MSIFWVHADGQHHIKSHEIGTDEFESVWGKDSPSIVQSWRRNWQSIIPFFGDKQPANRRLKGCNVE
jgi:transposase-like protein